MKSRGLAFEWRWVLLSTGVLFAVAGFLSISIPSSPGNVPTLEIIRERFVHQVSAEGILKAAKSTSLPAPVSAHGPVRIGWMIEDGSPVVAGEVIVRFDSTDLEKEWVAGKAELETAGSKVDKQRAEAAAEVNNLARDTHVAELELQSAREFQPKDEGIFSRNDIIESQIDEKLATHRVEHFAGARKTREALSKTDEDLLIIERSQAELKIRQAEDGLSALEMKAPHDGIVVFRRDWRGELPEVGDMVWRNQALGEIPMLDEMQAEVQVLEADAGGLAVGCPARVVLEAVPESSYKARIVRVDSIPKQRTRGVPVQYFGVTLELEQTDPDVMKPGQRVRSTLVLEERADAIAVPIQAIFERQSTNVIYRLGGRDFEPVEVVLGPSSQGRVVVEQGLDEGDVIALRDPRLAEIGTALAGASHANSESPR